MANPSCVGPPECATQLSAVTTARQLMMSSTSMAPQFAYQKCSALTSRQKINEFINQRRIPLPDRPA